MNTIKNPDHLKSERKIRENFVQLNPQGNLDFQQIGWLSKSEIEGVLLSYNN